MNLELEDVKQRIRELSVKIAHEEEEWLWESYEHDIVKLIIEYTLKNAIDIPGMNLSLVGKIINDEPYDYFTPFIEAMSEAYLTKPQANIHPDIKELLDCWKIES